MWYDLSEVQCPLNLSQAIPSGLNDKPGAATTSADTETIAKSAKVAASRSGEEEPITLRQAADYMGRWQ